MNGFDFRVYAYLQDWVITAYEPFAGAPFVVHTGRQDKVWRVAHRTTSYIAGYPKLNTRKSAIELAAELSHRCPDAARVKIHLLEAGRHKLTGPHRKFKAQLLAAHNELFPKRAAA